jgi:hypothetical protein
VLIEKELVSHKVEGFYIPLIMIDIFPEGNVKLNDDIVIITREVEVFTKHDVVFKVVEVPLRVTLQEIRAEVESYIYEGNII